MKPPHHVAQLPMRTLTRRGCAWLAPLLGLLAGVAAGCSGGRAEVGGQPPVQPVDPHAPLAAGTIGPAGGRIEVTAGPHAGVAFTVQPGALGGDKQFAIRLEQDETSVPSLFPVYRFEPADHDFRPGAVAVSVRAAAPFFAAGFARQGALALFSRPGAAGPFEVQASVLVDDVAQTVTASPTRLGCFVATNGALHRLFTQEMALVDPALQTRFENVGGAEITIANGSTALMLGRGSLDAFWSAPASANVLILHGLSRTPLDFRGPYDLVQSLAPSVQNVVLAVYPSALGVAANANALYDLVRARQHPGFGCTIIGHSLGGNIGRYMIEQSANDPSRPGYTPGDLPLSDVVAALFLMGTPNAGSAVACELLAALAPNLPPADARFVRAGIDLLEGFGTFTAAQNAAYTDNATVYHTICGDVGDGSDGIVTVQSARALPLFPPEELIVFAQSHVDLHRGAAWNGVAAWINARLPSP